MLKQKNLQAYDIRQADSSAPTQCSSEMVGCPDVYSLEYVRHYIIKLFFPFLLCIFSTCCIPFDLKFHTIIGSHVPQPLHMW